jgi:hypothetical protein
MQQNYTDGIFHGGCQRVVQCAPRARLDPHKRVHTVDPTSVLGPMGGHRVETVGADEAECVAMAESQVDIQGGQLRSLTGWDLSKYDYTIVSKEGFIPISVKPTTSTTWLINNII